MGFYSGVYASFIGNVRRGSIESMDMKTVLKIILLQLLTLCAFGQTSKQTVFRQYEHKEKIGSSVQRLLWSIRGEPTYAWKETLLLMSDSSFVYKYAGGECGTFDHTGTGMWTIKKNELKLRQNKDCYMLDSSYIMNKGVLYSSRIGVNGKAAEFKRK